MNEESFLTRGTQEGWMREALQEARCALEDGEVPVGSVVVLRGRIVARGHNQVERLRDATAHAEMLAITQASASVRDWRLAGAELYATLEPCSMCSGAMVLSRIKKVVYGAEDPLAGACGSVFNVAAHRTMNHRVEVLGGILREECSTLLKDFFRSRRKST